ncbi:MAG: hypothetical protein EOM85_03170 [Candidatus Moranbacteria bacterium]|nr:hypothetical protein [Candidatus Moranbacteria bacterium]
MQGFFSAEQVKTIRKPARGIFSCSSCGRYLLCNTPKFEVYGEGKKGIVNILPYPTEMQDSKGDILFNKNVRYLDKIFAEQGINLARDCTTLFAVACYSSKKVTPLPAHLEACRSRLFTQLKKLSPKLIFLYGDIPCKSVIGASWHKDYGTVDKWCGWTIPDQELNAWVIPLATVDSRGISEEYRTVWDMYWKQGFSKLYLPMTYVSPVYDLYTEEKDICKVLRRTANLLSRTGTQIAFDYETTGLKPHKTDIHKIVCVSFSYRYEGEQKTFCIKLPKSVEGKNELRRILQNPRIGKIAHNIRFEASWTKNILGYDVTPWVWDSMLAAHILDSRDKVSGLKFQTYINFGVAGYDDEVQPYLKAIDPKDGNSLNRVLEYIKSERNYLKLMQYCALDSLYTLELAERQQALIMGEVE